MLGHLTKHEGGATCKICGRVAQSGEQFHYITGLGEVCHRCGLDPVVCDLCGARVRRMTLTVLRGKSLCLNCYKKERESGEKRAVREVQAPDIGEALKIALENSPKGFRLIGLRLKTSSKASWQAEYEREDIYQMRCS